MNTEPENDSNSLFYGLKRLGIGILIALPFLGAGLYIMGISYGFLPSDPESFLAPRGIVGLAGAFFVVGGLMVLLNVSFGENGQKSMLFKLLNHIIGLMFVTIFGLLFAWAGLGPGERVFEGGISVGPLSIWGGVKTLLGRGLFGIIGLFFLLAVLFRVVTLIYSGLLYVYRKIKNLLTRNLGDQIEHLE
jgi:hypothetical protein